MRRARGHGRRIPQLRGRPFSDSRLVARGGGTIRLTFRMRTWDEQFKDVYTMTYSRERLKEIAGRNEAFDFYVYVAHWMLQRC